MLAAAGTCAAQTAPVALPHAYAHADCAPWDGPAVRIVLTPTPVPDSVVFTPSRPALDLAVYASRTRSLGHRFEVQAQASGDGYRGRAAWCPAESACEPAQGGWILLEGDPADSALRGRYELQFRGRQAIRGRFTAAWRPVRMACG
jgi:hypothetical protein